MRLNLKSYTLWFNLILLGAGIFAPFLNDNVKNILITNALIGLGLRAKTKTPLITRSKK